METNMANSHSFHFILLLYSLYPTCYLLQTYEFERILWSSWWDYSLSLSRKLFLSYEVTLLYNFLLF